MRAITEANLLLSRVCYLPAAASVPVAVTAVATPSPVVAAVTPLTHEDLLADSQLAHLQNQLLSTEYQEAIQVLVTLSPSLLFLFGLDMGKRLANTPPGDTLFKFVCDQAIRDIRVQGEDPANEQ
jgi:hypothetical protein